VLATDIETITHFPSLSKIVIRLKNKRRCAHPRLFARLSGQYLSTIDFEQTKKVKHITYNNGTTLVTHDHDPIITGYYKVPSPGRYYLEIIGLLCNDFEFDTDFTPICLENPSTHRITSDSAWIDVFHVVPQQKAGLPPPPGDDHPTSAAATATAALGYWKWSLDEKVPVPMFTRYQPKGCRAADTIQGAHCIETMTIDRFLPYRFVWNDDKYNSILHRDSSHEKIKICLIGLSHSREMKVTMNAVLQTSNISNIVVDNIDTKYPVEVSSGLVARIVGMNCTKTVVAVGQWPAGPRPPILFPEYKRQMADVIRNFKNAKADIGFHLRSIHYNPLGDTKSNCPPDDWRSPSTIDGYNDIIKNLSANTDVPYIDTNFILRPMWDSAPDWCHYKNKVGSVEALYILRLLIGQQTAL
jgi:hypothetical protein